MNVLHHGCSPPLIFNASKSIFQIYITMKGPDPILQNLRPEPYQIGNSARRELGRRWSDSPAAARTFTRRTSELIVINDNRSKIITSCSADFSITQLWSRQKALASQYIEKEKNHAEGQKTRKCGTRSTCIGTDETGRNREADPFPARR